MLNLYVDMVRLFLYLVVIQCYVSIEGGKKAHNSAVNSVTVELNVFIF